MRGDVSITEFPSPDWLEALKEKLNTDNHYNAVARKWEGDLYFDIRPEGNLRESVGMYLDLWHGKCRKAELVLEKDMDKYKPEFTIAGTLATWRKINEKKMDGTQALLTRQLKLTGNMAKVMRATGATRALSEATQTVKAVFPE